MIASKLIVGGIKEKRLERAIQIAREKLGEVPIFSHPDVFFIEGINSITITQIRDLGKNLILKPYLSSWKIAIIHEAEKLTLAAQNALLKTLEEPPKDSLIILTAPRKNLLLPTIVSRCEVIRIKPEKIAQEIASLINLKNKKIGERLKIATLYSSNKAQAQEFIEALLIHWREIMRKNPSLIAVRKLRLIQTSLFLLQNNVSPLLITGNLLLRLL